VRNSDGQLSFDGLTSSTTDPCQADLFHVPFGTSGGAISITRGPCPNPMSKTSHSSVHGIWPGCSLDQSPAEMGTRGCWLHQRELKFFFTVMAASIHRIQAKEWYANLSNEKREVEPHRKGQTTANISLSALSSLFILLMRNPRELERGDLDQSGIKGFNPGNQLFVDQGFDRHCLLLFPCGIE